VSDPASPPQSTFSLVDGGPFCRVMRRLRWVLPDGRCHYRRAASVIVAVTWGPLMVMGLIDRMLTGHAQPIDWGIQARLLITIPLLFMAEAALHTRTRRTVELFTSEHWARDQDDRVARFVASAGRLRDAVAPEVILLAVALIGSQAVVWRFGGPQSALHRLILDPRYIVPTYWYALVALPVFQFLVFRSLWRWVIWSRLLWQLSRLRLQPLAIHPDLAGGLVFLSLPSAAFAYVVAGMSAAQAGVWANKVLTAGAQVTSFKAPLLVFTVAAVVVALGPLIVFTGHLWRCRSTGKIQYGSLATDYTRLFHARWIKDRQRGELLGTADIQSLADLGNSYEIVARTRLLPFTPRVVALIAAAAIAPAIPVALLRIPLMELLAKVGGTVLGKGGG
jgi:hypothetical protein